MSDEVYNQYVSFQHFPLMKYPEERRQNKCDFIIGMFFLRELWNPLQNLAQILKLVRYNTCV